MKRWLWLFLGLTLAGCAVGPNYHRPSVDAPPVFRGGSVVTNSLGDLSWWQLFQDPVLQLLIREGLTNNYDIRIAAARLQQAHAMWMENRSLFFPQVNYLGGVGYGKNVANNQPSNNGGKEAGGFVGDANVTWEIDLFGRIRRLNEAARAQYFATAEARHDIQAALVSDLAQAYFQLLALDQEMRIAEDSTNSFGQSMKIFNERYHGGVASRLEVASAAALQASSASALIDLRRQITVQEDFISTLLGVNPDAIPRGQTLISEAILPDVPAGLPSGLLERRPDIREAEQNLRAANATIGVATADFFPRLNLTSLLGASSSDLTAITAGANRSWEIAAGFAGPIFEGGLLTAQYRAARAAWDEARLQYQQTILTSFREVSDALAARQDLAAERLEQVNAVNAYQEAVKVANERYRVGQASYYEVLQEQQLLFPAENTLTQIELSQLNAIVQLYRALGGGWQTGESQGSDTHP